MTSAMAQSVENPLLNTSPFPLWDEVKAEHVVPAIRQLLEETSSEIDALEKNVEPTWGGLVEPLERIVDRLGRAWGTVSHLKAVKDTEALRKAVEEVQPYVGFGSCCLLNRVVSTIF
jgi:oligopeptidase A